MTSRAGTRTLVTTDEVMGTVVSLHVVVVPSSGSDDDAGSPTVASARVQAAVAGFLASMHDDDAMFSPFKADSAISRIQRGELSLADAPALVREVESACLRARDLTAGRFDAWWRGFFDPTGYVKGWSVERAFVAHLLPLVTADGGAPEVVSVGVSVGGDLRVATRPGHDRQWRIGIADPHDRSTTLGTIVLSDGAVATSGTAERGEHIIDPSTGGSATSGGVTPVVSATVVADSLEHADLWATTAVVAGFDDLSWISEANTASGLLVAADGRTRRWAGIAELVDAED